MIQSTSILVSLLRAKGYNHVLDVFDPEFGANANANFDKTMCADFLGEYSDTMAAMPPGSEDMFIARRNFVDDLIYGWRCASTPRYYFSRIVLLGSGMDPLAGRLAFARRMRPDMFPGSPQIVEIDTQEVLDFKRERVAASNNKNGSIFYDDEAVIYAPCDFSVDGALQRVLREVCDETYSTLFVAMGLTYYLSRDEVESLIMDVARMCGKRHNLGGVSAFAFDYAPSNGGDKNKAREAVEKLGEKSKIMFTTHDIAPTCFTLGLRSVREISFTNWWAKNVYQGHSSINIDDQRSLRFVVAQADGIEEHEHKMVRWPYGPGRVKEAKYSSFFVG